MVLHALAQTCVDILFEGCGVRRVLLHVLSVP
jgi:hypothetical protein